MRHRHNIPTDKEFSDAIINLAVSGVEVAFAREAFSPSTLAEIAGSARGSSVLRGMDEPRAVPATEVGLLAGATGAAPAARSEGSALRAVGALLARVVLVVLVGVPWICGLLWLAWNL